MAFYDPEAGEAHLFRAKEANCFYANKWWFRIVERRRGESEADFLADLDEALAKVVEVWDEDPQYPAEHWAPDHDCEAFVEEYYARIEEDEESVAVSPSQIESVKTHDLPDPFADSPASNE